MPTLRDVVGVLDGLYDPRWADSWDAVGTVVGDPDAPVAKVLFAVDPVLAVVDEAVAWGADLVVAHHPLWLKGVTSVAATSPKGRVVHTLISNGIALHTCHTNADSPPLGVSESMALALGLADVRPLEADPADPTDTWVVFVPEGDADRVASAMHGAGAGAMGDYDSTQFQSTGTGSFRPLEGADPAIGEVGTVERVAEVRIEMMADRRRSRSRTHRTAGRASVRRGRLRRAGAGRQGHRPGQRPHRHAAGRDDSRGVRSPGRRRACRRITALRASPATQTRPIRTVALCGGSGDFLLGHANASGADVYVTSDLRHHPVSEHLETPGACAVIDVPHWAAEWTWLPVASAALWRAAARHRGQGLDDRDRSLDLSRVVRAEPSCAP